jgi:hypothetical protein
MEHTHTSGDADLILAEMEIASIFDRLPSMPEGDAADNLAVRADKLDRFIATTAPTTLVGAAVKIRRMLDPDTGIAIGRSELDIVSLAQVMTLLHRLTGSPRHPIRPFAGC